MPQYRYSDGNTISVTDATCHHTSKTFLEDGKLWEVEAIHEFFSQVPRNTPCNIVDIGAQSGLYSLYAKFLPKATFYSYEPYELTFGLLQDNLRLNGIDNVKASNIGISDEKGSTTLNVCVNHNGLHTMGVGSREGPFRPVSVTTDTLDNLFYAQNIPVHFIKIDTEGWEYNILRGGENTLKTYKPTLQVEYSKINMAQCDVKPVDLQNLWESYGYTVAKDALCRRVRGTEEVLLVPDVTTTPI